MATLHVMFMHAYLIGPDQRLNRQVILHQLLHIGLTSNQRGELRSCRQTERRLIGGARRSTGVGVPEKYIPRLEEEQEGRNGRRENEESFNKKHPSAGFSPPDHHPCIDKLIDWDVFNSMSDVTSLIRHEGKNLCEDSLTEPIFVKSAVSHILGSAEGSTSSESNRD